MWRARSGMDEDDGRAGRGWMDGWMDKRLKTMADLEATKYHTSRHHSIRSTSAASEHPPEVDCRFGYETDSTLSGR